MSCSAGNNGLSRSNQKMGMVCCLCSIELIIRHRSTVFKFLVVFQVTSQSGFRIPTILITYFHDILHHLLIKQTPANQHQTLQPPGLRFRSIYSYHKPSSPLAHIHRLRSHRLAHTAGLSYRGRWLHNSQSSKKPSTKSL